jgi:hypothetical protein
MTATLPMQTVNDWCRPTIATLPNLLHLSDLLD